ncbi:MAG TPA: peptidoglycan DD-metalloendopeptidase family protein [Gammaproteobacteria bacterium]|nr:peptidoglycan DD-metalloendopeptidase family protein [Gammaproteobacteria bacterium]
MACTTASNPPLSRRDARAAVHVVQRGETLSKIAWQHRVDPQELANWNGVTDPDALRIGQRLRLVPPRGYVALPTPPPVARTAPNAAPPPAPTRATPPRSSSAPRSSTTAPQQRPSAAPPARPSSTPARQSAPPPAQASPPRWSWPTDGRIVAGFGSADGIESGIGIAGREGQPVRAAAAGRVVYAGGGLMGYGQLVIIKHDETFLSAYGYNSELLVTQGQDVVRGATIALMGQGPGRQARLHFEIRRNGVPVDPLLFVTAPR